MNTISLLGAIAAPSDLWNNLITWIYGSVGNLGWAILLLTLLVKLATSPLDFMVKFTTKKQTLVQQKCAPQIAKLQKKFGSDQQTLKVQTSALYKREGLNMGTGCVIMLVNLILTCAIFFTFYSSLRTISAYQAINQYEVTYEAYDKTFTNYVYESNKQLNNDYTIEDTEKLISDFETSYQYINNAENDSESAEFKSHEEFVEKHQTLMQEATNAASTVALDTWNANKSSWLWVQNIWVADAPTYPFPTYDELKKNATEAGTYYIDYVNANIDANDYNTIATYINSKTTSQNGYYILAILAGVVTYLSSLIADLHNKLKNKKANNLATAANQQSAGSMKIMKIIMPIIMIMFVLSSSASFGIYLLASNIAGIAIGEIVNLIVNKLTKKKRIEVEEYLAKEADRLIKKGKLQG